MKTFLKIMFLLLIMAVLAGVILFTVYKDTLRAKASSVISGELSRIFERPVEIGHIEYFPFQSITLKNIVFLRNEEVRAIFAKVDEATITIDIPSLIKSRRLKTTISIENISLNDISCNIMVRTRSLPAPDFMKVFDTSLINSVFIIDAEMKTKHFSVSNIVGDLDVRNMTVIGGKVHFSYNDTTYLVEGAIKYPEAVSYNMSIRTDNFRVQAEVSEDNDLFTFKNMRGNYYTLLFNLDGELNDFMHQGKDSVFSFYGNLSGRLETDLADLRLLPGKAGELAERFPVSGILSSNLELKIESLDPADIDLSADVFIEDLEIDRLSIQELTGVITYKDGRLKASSLKGFLYEGYFLGNITLGLLEKNLPYIFSAKIEDVNFNSMLRGLTDTSTDITGIFHSEISVQGYADLPSTAEGTASLGVTDADLGPMPILTPLLGDIFSTLQNVFSSKSAPTIDQAYGDLVIKNRKVMTDNFTLWGSDIVIRSQGYIDFSGNIDLSFQNQVREVEEEAWQTSLRNAIVSFGKMISKARLRGTIKDPKWELEYLSPIKNMLGSNLKSFSDVSE